MKPKQIIKNYFAWEDHSDTILLILAYTGNFIFTALGIVYVNSINVGG